MVSQHLKSYFLLDNALTGGLFPLWRSDRWRSSRWCRMAVAVLWRMSSLSFLVMVGSLSWTLRWWAWPCLSRYCCGRGWIHDQPCCFRLLSKEVDYVGKFIVKLLDVFIKYGRDSRCCWCCSRWCRYAHLLGGWGCLQ